MSTPATTIDVTTGTDMVTLVNVFTVDPARQIELVDALDRATRDIFATAPGFISANLHVARTTSRAFRRPGGPGGWPRR